MFELWKQPARLADALARLIAAMPAADEVVVTMTAELCDCYETKAAGVLDVLDACLVASDRRPVRVWSIDGRFHTPEEIGAEPGLAAAANWLALATLAARQIPDGPALTIDVGSTTADLIPCSAGKPCPRGRTDPSRLGTGELVYAGVRRTPVCALARDLPYRGTPTGLAAELFATTLDVYLTLGEVAPDADDRSTADGRPATVDAARDRLARMVGADRDGFSPEDAFILASAADAALLDRLEAAAIRACEGAIGEGPGAVVVSGSGGFLARRLAGRLLGPGGVVVDLGQVWGPSASEAGCAFALLTLAAERPREGFA